MKDISQLTPEQQQRIESIHINEAGIASPKLHSASWANSELRKFHSMGQTSEDNSVQKLSDAELITQLANQAKELGIEIDLSYRLGDSPEAGGGRARGLYEGPEIRATVSTDTPLSVPRVRG
jgi:hypothetical protein